MLYIASAKLRYPIETAATAIGLLHRYGNTVGDERLTVSNSVVLLGSFLFLAGKGTEKFRKVREVLVVVLKLCGYPTEVDETKYAATHEKLIEKEHSILRTLSFDTTVSLPYPYLLNIARSLSLTCAPVKLAWALVNDLILHAELSLEHPSSVAVVTLYLAINSIGPELSCTLPQV